VRPEELVNEKFPMIPPEIEPDTFRHVVQCLNQLRLRVLEKKTYPYCTNLFIQRCHPNEVLQ
jgi:hypothetical protein